MARIKMAYLGGGSTRGAGTMAILHAPGRELRRVRGRPDRPRRRAPRPDPASCHTDGKGAWPRHHRDGDDRPARGANRLRRGALELPAGRFRGAHPGRAHPTLARHDRAGDAGGRRVLHGPAVGARVARRGRGPGGCRTAGEGVQLHEPGQRRGAGLDAQLRHPLRLALRGPDVLRQRAVRGLLASIPTCSTAPWSGSTTAPGASVTSTTAATSSRT